VAIKFKQLFESFFLKQDTSFHVLFSALFSPYPWTENVTRADYAFVDGLQQRFWVMLCCTLWRQREWQNVTSLNYRTPVLFCGREGSGELKVCMYVCMLVAIHIPVSSSAACSPISQHSFSHHSEIKLKINSHYLAWFSHLSSIPSLTCWLLSFSITPVPRSHDENGKHIALYGLYSMKNPPFLN